MERKIEDLSLQQLWNTVMQYLLNSKRLKVPAEVSESA